VRFESRRRSPRSCRRGFRTLSAIHLLDPSKKKRDLQVIGEVSDGLKAVQEAVELKPDLIIMDIGLPSLNGIEAARQIRKLVPESKIIFFSQEYSADVVQEALSLGARGYVVKTRGTDLLAAVDAVVLGKRFVSRT
jgi:DNA-binding NarL/FixJ family response regulator